MHDVTLIRNGSSCKETSTNSVWVTLKELHKNILPAQLCQHSLYYHMVMQSHVTSIHTWFGIHTLIAKIVAGLINGGFYGSNNNSCVYHWVARQVVDSMELSLPFQLEEVVQKIYYSPQQQKVKSIKYITTIITELVVVWSVCSTCTCTVKQRFLWPQLLMQRFTLLLQMLQGVVKQQELEYIRGRSVEPL